MFLAGKNSFVENLDPETRLKYELDQETIEIMKAAQKGQQLVMDSMNQACAKNQDSSTAAESDNYLDLEVHLFEFYSSSFA